MSRKSNTFSFRLRKIDVDLEEAIQGIDPNALSDMCRDGLRIMLGLKTTKRIEVTERPIKSFSDSESNPVRSKPITWINNNKK